MRYYNENPQVVYWREKYEQLSIDNYLSIQLLQEENIRLSEENQHLRNYAELPWYKKLFIKFKP